MMALRCRLGRHDFCFVNEHWRGKFPGVKVGWNHECARCGKTYWRVVTAEERARREDGDVDE